MDVYILRIKYIYSFWIYIFRNEEYFIFISYLYYMWNSIFREIKKGEKIKLKLVEGEK